MNPMIRSLFIAVVTLAAASGCSSSAAQNSGSPGAVSETRSLETAPQALTNIIYAKNYTKQTVYLQRGGSQFRIPPYPQSNGNVDEICYPGFFGSSGHAPVAAITSFKNIHDAPTPAGKTVVMFLELTLKKQASITFIGQNCSGNASFVKGEPFIAGQNYSLYYFSQGQQVAPPSQLMEYQSDDFYLFTTNFAGQTLDLGVPIFLEFVQN
jgi:hypothetical protein